MFEDRMALEAENKGNFSKRYVLAETIMCWVTFECYWKDFEVWCWKVWMKGFIWWRSSKVLMYAILKRNQGKFEFVSLERGYLLVW